MAFKGYYFNKINKKYLTCKYPNCYVGVINMMDEGASWGNFIDKPGIGSYFGKYNRSTISVSFATEYISNGGIDL